MSTKVNDFAIVSNSMVTFNNIYKQAITFTLEKISNLFYKSIIIKNFNNRSIVLTEDENINITLTEGFDNYFTFKFKEIVLSAPIMCDIALQNLPCFSLYYHELGHALYSKPLDDFETMLKDNLDKIKAFINSTGILSLNHKPGLECMGVYAHLLNWIEDYYIERTIVKEYPYLTDIIDCLHQVQLKDVDLLTKENIFRYYYKYEQASPALTTQQQKEFINYINKFLMLRDNPLFGTGTFTLLNSNKNISTMFCYLLFEFYDWCIKVGAIDPYKTSYAPLPTPIAVLNKKTKNKNNGLPTNNIQQTLSGVSSPNNLIGSSTNKNGANDRSGTHDTTMKGTIGELSFLGDVYEVYIPQIKSTPEMYTMATREMEQIRDTITYIESLNSTTETTDNLAVLFSKNKIVTAIMQSTVKIKNFFNPNRIADKMLFLKNQPRFLNATVYRDVSGSTRGEIFKLIDKTCKYLFNIIPIEPEFYLYASGNIADIVKTKYIPWENLNNPPNDYSKNALFQQLSTGTNSQAIGTVIRQQFNNNWLNIIITDGDLDGLYMCDDIYALLKNVFVIFIKRDFSQTKYKGIINYVVINDENDISKIESKLVNCFTKG